MATKEHLERIRSGVAKWNEWRKGTDVTPDLSGADLHGADLSEAYLNLANLSEAGLSEANLSEANLSEANLSEVNLSGADLHGANLREAYLNGAHLSGAYLREANLSEAELIGADLSRANLSGADLTGASLNLANLSEANLRETDVSNATLHDTVFANVNLSNTKGLDTCRHYGPSTVDHRTLTHSPDLPLVFLRGCGLPDNFIDTIRGPFHAGPIQLYSCFISYSSKDREFAERIYADLQNHGVRCWYAPEDVQGGKKLHEQLDDAIRLHDKLLLILSENSMGSEWVKTEIAKARKREVKDNKRVLFPISLVSYDMIRVWECFDADTGKDSAREIREYFIPDFTNWKDHDDYQEAFGRLLRDLKQESSAAR